MDFSDLFLAAIIDETLPESFILSPEETFYVEDMAMYVLEQRAAENGTLVDTEFVYH